MLLNQTELLSEILLSFWLLCDVVGERGEQVSQKWLTLRIGVAVALSRRDIQLLSLLREMRHCGR